MVSKIGITSFPSPSSPPSLPLSYETSISEYPVDLFDFLMLPFSVILDDINKSEKQTLPQISPDANLLPRISQFLLSIKSDTNILSFFFFLFFLFFFILFLFIFILLIYLLPFYFYCYFVLFKMS